jgi:hypothetical protein
MAKTVYFVGKPYPYIQSHPLFSSGEYIAGIFLDNNVRLKNKAGYKHIVPVDFTDRETMLSSITSTVPRPDALVSTYENYIVPKAQLAEHFSLPSQSVMSAKLSTNKNMMRQAFLDEDAGITPRFGTAETLDKALEIASSLNYPLIIKPTNLVKSLLVMRCDNEKELVSNFEYAKQNLGAIYKKYRFYNQQPQLIIEEFIAGTTCSIAAFANSKGEVSFCEGVVALKTAQDIGVNDNYILGRSLPAILPDKLNKQLFLTAKKGINALRMSSTPAHVELIYNNQGVKLIEIGARLGGYRPRMYSASYDIDLIHQEIQLAFGNNPDLKAKFIAYSAVYELFPNHEGTFAGISNPSYSSEFASYSLKAKLGSIVGPAKNGHKATSIIVIQHHDRNEFNRLCANAEKMKVKVI